MENPVVYWELASHDADKSSRFLQDVFGWQMEYDPATTIHEAPGNLAEGSCPGGGVHPAQSQTAVPDPVHPRG